MPGNQLYHLVLLAIVPKQVHHESAVNGFARYLHRGLADWQALPAGCYCPNCYNRSGQGAPIGFYREEQHHDCQKPDCHVQAKIRRRIECRMKEAEKTGCNCQCRPNQLQCQKPSKNAHLHPLTLEGLMAGAMPIETQSR